MEAEKVISKRGNMHIYTKKKERLVDLFRDCTASETHFGFPCVLDFHKLHIPSEEMNINS